MVVLDSVRYRSRQVSPVSRAGGIGVVVLAFLAGGSLPGSTAVAAEATADAYDLEEIVVTASRRSASAYAVPYAVNVQGMIELQEIRQVRTTPEALRELPGVMVQKTGHGQGSPYIRGFTGMRTLFLIDGIRLNNSTFRDGPNQYWNTVDPFSVYRLELVKGPSSVLYGSDAIGGTVNAISRAYGDIPSAQGLQTRFVVRGASAENSLVLRSEMDYSSDRVAVYGGISLKSFGDLSAGSGTGDQPKTGYDEQDANLAVRINLDDDRRLVIAVEHVNLDDAWRVHKTIFAKSWRGTTTGRELQRSLDQQRTLAYLQYQATNMSSWASDLTLSLSYQQQNEQRFRQRDANRIDRQGTDVGTLGLWGQITVPSNYGSWITGLEFYRDDVDSFRKNFDGEGNLTSTAIQGPVADNSSYLTAAAFLQNELSIGSRGSLQTGIRYTWSKADAPTVLDPQTGGVMSIVEDWGKLTGSIRYSQQLDAAGQTSLFGGISQGFRAPNLSDLTRFDSARSNEIETPTALLDHENFVTFEMGLKFIRTRFDGQLSLYYTQINDLIIRTPTGRIIDGENEVGKQNAGSGFVKGIEAQGRFQLDDAWSVFGNVTWVDGEVETFPTATSPLVDEPLDRLMPTRVYLGSRWQPVDSRGWIEALVTVSDKQDKLSTRDQADTDRIPPGGTPSYATLTLRGGWTISEHLQLALSLENVFDENYRIHGSGLNEPGRNLIMSLFWQP